MNPPFGEASLGSREYLYENLPEAARDVFAGFVTLHNGRLQSLGRLGVLSNRTAFFSDFLEAWRNYNVLGGSSSLQILGDLGYGVLDAVVEAAAYVCQRSRSSSATFVDCLGTQDKAQALGDAVTALSESTRCTHASIRHLASFRSAPDHKLLYQLPDRWLSNLTRTDEHSLFVSRSGLTTGDDFRYLRVTWEIPLGEINRRWRPVAKGGEFGRYQTNIHLAYDSRGQSHFARMRNAALYGKAGITYTERTTSNLSARILNTGSAFSVPGPGIIPNDPRHLAFLLSLFNSFVASFIIEGLIGGGDYATKGTAARHLEPGYMKHLPGVDPQSIESDWFREMISLLIELQDRLTDDDTHCLFRLRAINFSEPLKEIVLKRLRDSFKTLADAYAVVEEIENKVAATLGIPASWAVDTYNETGWPWPHSKVLKEEDIREFHEVNPFDSNGSIRIDFGATPFRFQMKLSHYLHGGVESMASKLRVHPQSICEVLSRVAIVAKSSAAPFVVSILERAIGFLLSRWDIRYATG